jgi:hypothetical protein
MVAVILPFVEPVRPLRDGGGSGRKAEIKHCKNFRRKKSTM